MKEIALIPDKPFHNNVDVSVMDFPDDKDHEKKRRRCAITVEFAESDVDDLKAGGMGLEAAMKYYEDYIYKLVKVNISSEWKCVEGWDQVMGIVREHVSAYF